MSNVVFTFVQIRAVAKYKKKSLQEIFGDLKLHICKFMVDTVIKQQQESKSEINDFCLQTFTTVSNVFYFKNIKTLMQVCVHPCCFYLALLPSTCGGRFIIYFCFSERPKHSHSSAGAKGRPRVVCNPTSVGNSS